MNQLKELLDREALRVSEGPDALDATLKAIDRRHRNVRLGTAIFVLASFGIIAAALGAALGHHRSSLGSQGGAVRNGSITVLTRTLAGTGVSSVDPVSGRTVSSPFVLLAQGSLGAWSPDGRYLTYEERAGWRVYDSATERSLDILPSRSAWFRWSPDSASVAYQSAGWVWRFDITTSTSTKLGSCIVPVGLLQPPLCGTAWSPDGSELAIAHPSSIDIVHTDGSGRIVSISGIPGSVVGDPSWSPDGSSLLVIARDGRSSALFSVRADGTGLHNLSALSGALHLAPAWSPDGSMVAYLSQGPVLTPGKGYELNATVVTLDGSAPSVIVPTGACYCLGFWPGVAWSPDSTELALVIPGTGPGKPVSGLYVMHADGSGLRLLRKGAWGQPAWSPVPVTSRLHTPLAPSGAS